MKRLLLLPLAVLAACGTPQEQCISRGTRDLRTVEKLIAETEGNLKRGYAFEDKVIVTERMVPCLVPPTQPPADGTDPPPPDVRFCEETEETTVRTPVAIDLEAEARKLRQLQDRRKALTAEAKQVIAACRAEYPE